jgi:hypothetical protein
MNMMWDESVFLRIGDFWSVAMIAAGLYLILRLQSAD